MTLENLIGKGLQREPAGKTEIARFRAKIATKLSDAQNKSIALQTLPITISYPREKVRLLDEFRRQRGQGLYDGTFDPSTAEVGALIEEATALQQQFLQWLSDMHPELF